MKITIDMVMQFMQERIPFNRFLAMEVTALETGFCRIEIPFRDELVGDPSKVQDRLGWKAQTMVPELARLMVDADLASLR